jgi:rubredoxin
MSFISRHSRLCPFNVSIATAGGVFSATQLRHISETALTLGDGRIQLGAGQAFLLTLEDPDRYCKKQTLPGLSIHPFSAAPPVPRITSALPWLGLGEGSVWLRESHYLQLIEQLGHHTPALAFDVHLADPRQRWGLRHAATVNLLASGREDYWRLTLNLPGQPQPWVTPYAIHTRAAAETLAAFNTVGMQGASEAEEHLATLAAGFLQHGWLVDPTPLPPAPQRHEPCDGWLRQTDDRLALGLLHADFSYAPTFLLEVSLLAQRQALRRIGITPWQGLVVRDIAEDQAGAWRLLLSQHGIALRRTPPSAHFWQLSAETARFHSWRHRLINELDRHLGPAADLSFALTDEMAQPAAMIVIRHVRSHGLGDRFDLYHRLNFVEAAPLQRFAQRCRRNQLSALIVRQVREHLAASSSHAQPESIPRPQPASERMVCSACQTQYDPTWGDARVGIPPGILFAELPTDWCCPVCSAPPDHFQPLSIASHTGVHDEQAA